jgi:hypothetical protein
MHCDPMLVMPLYTLDIDEAHRMGMMDTMVCPFVQPLFESGCVEHCRGTDDEREVTDVLLRCGLLGDSDHSDGMREEESDREESDHRRYESDHGSDHASRWSSESDSDSNSDGSWPCYTEAECMCENHGFNMTQCESMACCQWGEDAVGGQCWADNERCGSGSDSNSDSNSDPSDVSDGDRRASRSLLQVRFRRDRFFATGDTGGSIG